MENISQEELNKILKEHVLWLKREGGKRADLSCANLSGADLRNVNLTYADLSCAHLINTDLSGANLSDANLSDTELWNANLTNTDLSCADLSGADLEYANLSGADLRNVNLWNANLQHANLENIKTNMYTIGYNLACPEEGSFIGYKKAGRCIIKLLILEDAKRSSATTFKCRCDKAKVLDIEDINTGKKIEKTKSNYDPEFIYRVGEIITVDDFDDNRWNECSTGIHFFVNKEHALSY